MLDDRPFVDLLYFNLLDLNDVFCNKLCPQNTFGSLSSNFCEKKCKPEIEISEKYTILNQKKEKIEQDKNRRKSEKKVKNI